jgi:5-methylcytosine-specific restriction endonuclease McrA
MKVPSIIMMTKQVKWNKNVKYSRFNIFLRDNFLCQLQITNDCKNNNGKVKLSDLTIDHVIPKSLGGKSKWTNVCTSCIDCNAKKGNNGHILPKIVPKKPTYYEILTKKQTHEIFVKDMEWAYYISWPLDLVKISSKS